MPNREIGHVSLIKVREGYFETHSSLNNEFHGKGLGALLYARAIQYALDIGWGVRSSGQSSELAQRVWRGKTIRKYFSIKLQKGEDSYYDKWYAYAK
jgi:GNAT superfamily N-acetyltransferase